MDCDIFVCYSSDDKAVAEAICAKLGIVGVRCRLAQRNIIYRSELESSNYSCILSCSIMVFVFSKNSNESIPVRREVEAASCHNVVVVPFRIDNSEPSLDLKFHTGAVHWLDASTGPLEVHIDRLVSIVSEFIDVRSQMHANNAMSACGTSEQSTEGRGEFVDFSARRPSTLTDTARPQCRKNSVSGLMLAPFALLGQGLGWVRDRVASVLSGELATHSMDVAPCPPETSEYGRGKYPPDAAQGDEVDCSVYAPPRVSARSRFLIQAYAHLAEQAMLVREQAKEIDPSSSLRGASALGTIIAPRSRLGFELILPGCEIDAPMQHLVWRRRADYVSFEILAPKERNGGQLMGSLIVSQDDVPIGRIKFKLELTESTIESASVTSVGEAKRFNLAFISYCSKDRDEVLRRVQMLSLAGVPYVQDLLSLEPGDLFETKLLRWIDESDVMFLFWSDCAKKSSWVEKEWKYALENKNDDYILPVIIEGPPFPEPPVELKHLHWSDKILYFLSRTNCNIVCCL